MDSTITGGAVVPAPPGGSPGLPVVIIDTTNPGAVSWCGRNSNPTTTVEIPSRDARPTHSSLDAALASMAEVTGIPSDLMPLLVDELARTEGASAVVHRRGGLFRASIRIEVVR